MLGLTPLERHGCRALATQTAHALGYMGTDARVVRYYAQGDIVKMNYFSKDCAKSLTLRDVLAFDFRDVAAGLKQSSESSIRHIIVNFTVSLLGAILKLL